MKIWIDEARRTVYETPAGAYVIASMKDFDQTAMQIKIQTDEEIKSVKVRPLSMRIQYHIVGDMILFSAPAPAKISVEINNDLSKPVFLFLYDKEEKHEKKPDELYFPAGEHDAGTIEMRPGMSIYLEEGAVVHGTISARQCDHISISGRGIFDVSSTKMPAPRMALFIQCHHLKIKDVSFIGSPTWALVPTGCKNMEIEGANIITWEIMGDGIDVVGCENAKIRGCFVYTCDDCIALKATEKNGEEGCAPCRNIQVRDCVFWNARGGNAIEIGFETRCEEICNVTFEDIDVIHCMYEGWQAGGTITIHNGDRARIHNIVYRNIRIEDARQKLFDLKILKSVYSIDESRGSIENILFENIAVTDGEIPASVFFGYPKVENMIKNIRFVNLTYHGEKIMNCYDARIAQEVCSGITFE